MFRYIVEHDLEDVIVEFSLFDIEVGIKMNVLSYMKLEYIIDYLEIELF